MESIAQWWPLLDEQIRRVLVNGIWSPVSDFARGEIERLGGPGADDNSFWDTRNRDHRLPQAAVQWIIATADFQNFVEPPKPDPRAAYFRQGWPHRRP